MLSINSRIQIAAEEIQFVAIRAQGAGGQNVNKVSSAVQLRFSVPASSLPEACKQRLLELRDRRISKDGVIVIKAQRFRNQEQNREDALERLKDLITKALEVQAVRRPTRPTRGSKQRRMDQKTQRGQTKALRRNVRSED